MGGGQWGYFIYPVSGVTCWSVHVEEHNAICGVIFKTSSALCGLCGARRPSSEVHDPDPRPEATSKQDERYLYPAEPTQPRHKRFPRFPPPTTFLNSKLINFYRSGQNRPTLCDGPYPIPSHCTRVLRKRKAELPMGQPFRAAPMLMRKPLSCPCEHEAAFLLAARS